MNATEVDDRKKNYVSDARSKTEISTVMIVDDDPIIRMILNKVIMCDRPLTSIIECNNGDDAYNKMNGEISLIFTDNNMPIVSGMEFIRKIKADPAYADIPVVMVSVEAREEYKSFGKELGITGWLVKPFDIGQIREYLNRYL
jgi:two-component system chemotaxis response regulator CheY